MGKKSISQNILVVTTLRDILDHLWPFPPYMNDGFNHRFETMTTKMDDMAATMEDMADTLNNMKHSPTRSNSKLKSMHTPEIVLRDQPGY